MLRLANRKATADVIYTNCLLTFLMKACRMDVLSHWVLRKSSMYSARFGNNNVIINTYDLKVNLNTRQNVFSISLCHCLRTWVGCRQSGRQSWYCGGHPRWRKARAGTHASLGVDAFLAPVAGRAEVHSRTRGVRWRWWKRGAMLWLVGVVTRLRMAQCLLIRWRTISFRIHYFAEPPWMEDTYIRMILNM